MLIAGSGIFDDSSGAGPVDKVHKSLRGNEKADSGPRRSCFVFIPIYIKEMARNATPRRFRETSEEIKPLERFVNRAKYRLRPKIDR